MAFQRDLKSNIDVQHSLAPAVGTGSRTGTGVDLLGYDGAVAVVHFGAWTDGTHTAKPQDSSDNTTFSDVSSSNLLGSFTGISATGSSNTTQRVGYIGGARYVRAFITASASTVITGSAATIVRGFPNRQPLS
jgi:hypothetical protein